MELKNTKQFIFKNAPTILTCMNIGASVLAVASSIDATIKAVKRAEEMQNENPDIPVEPVEIVKECAPYYISSGVLLATSAVCSVEANKISLGRLAGTAGLYAAEVATNELIRQTTKESVSDQKYEQIESAVAKKKCEQEDQEGKYNELPTEIFGFEWFSMEGQVFGANRTDVKQAFLDLSADLMSWQYVSLDEVFDKMNDICKYGHLEHTDVSNSLVWSNERCKQIEYRLDPFDNGRVTVNKIQFRDPPLIENIY